MKKTFSNTILLALILLPLVCGVGPVLAATYLDQVCIDLETDGDYHRAFNLALSEAAPGYYQLSGKFSSPTASADGAVVGSAFLKDAQNAVISLQESHLESTGLAIATYNFELAIHEEPLLIGTFKSISQGQSDNFAAASLTGTASLDFCSNPVPDGDTIDNDGDGYTENQEDCDDSDAAINLDAVEICGDGIDQDCSGSDEACPGDQDSDADGYTLNEGDCDDNQATINPGAEEICGNDIDEDCADGAQECAIIDVDEDGFSPPEDCNDNNASINTDAAEICGDGIDQDCSGADEICAEDIDNDGDGSTENEGDCDDNDASIHPGANEISADGIDQDCNGIDYIAPYTETSSGINMGFVGVAAGCYDMGDGFNAGQSDEIPVHEVCVNSFYMGKFEVTQGQWQEVTGSSARNTACGSTCPVTEVSYTDAQLFITMLNNQTGKTYRLPTEAEWEYAARSGGQDLQYGNSASVTLSNYAWYTSNSSNQIHPAGQKQPNELGLYDMAGNVTEWVKDLYDADYYGSSSSPKQNPQGPGSGLGYVTRGGYYSSGPTSLRTSDRSYSQDTYSAPMLGFRVVRTIN